MSISGQLWTIWPKVRDSLKAPPPPPPERPWSVELEDPCTGTVRLSGRLSDGGSPSLVILVHGLGGSQDSPYMVRAARAAARLGLSSLRLNQRGADRNGRDFYHAGLSGDLAHVLASPALASFEDLYLLGFSLGGHVSLRFATEVEDPRLRAVAAISSPLDLEVSVNRFDQPAGYIYRRYILRSLVDMVERLELDGLVAASLDELRRVRLLREWDRLTVVPRFGFESASDYYRRASICWRLHRLRRPALLVATDTDPLVAAPAVREPLDRYAASSGNGDSLPESFEVKWVRGGHVSFPGALDLGQPGPPGVYGQALTWLASHRP